MARGNISFATFNLYNLNEPERPIYTDRNGWSAEEYERKIVWTARMLECVAADVIGFQELWHAASLEAAFARTAMLTDYELLVPSGTDGSKIVCAAAVRKSLVVPGSPRWIEDFPESFRLESGGDDRQSPDIAVNLKGFSRPVLHFKLLTRADRPAIHVFVCHFKSKGPSKVFRESWFKDAPDIYKPHQTALGAALSTIRRTAEAAALRWMITELAKGTPEPVVVIGDLNDGQHSNTLNILTAQPNYLKPFRTPAGADDALYSAQSLQQLQTLTDVYYTHIYKQARESLDHVLVSEEFYDGSRDRVWGFEELIIENDHLNYEDHKARGTGDHGVVRVEFKLRPKLP